MKEFEAKSSQANRSQKFPLYQQATHGKLPDTLTQVSRRNGTTHSPTGVVLQNNAGCLVRGHLPLPPNALGVLLELSLPLIRETGTDGAEEIIAFFARLDLNLPCPVRGQRPKNSDLKLNESGTQSAGCGRHAFLEVESSPFVPNVQTGPEACSKHDKGGVFLSHITWNGHF